MQTGLMIHNYKVENLHSQLKDLAQAVDAPKAFDSLWVLDHFFAMGQADDPMLEAYSVLHYLAALTERVELGVMVTGVIYRIPGVLIKTVTTLDILSNGRAWLGIGAAWYEREALGLGIPFPSLKERFEWLEETLQIAKEMWGDSITKFDGTYFQLDETLNQPQSIQRPHPPILIGGMGEKKTLRMVAQYANASNFGGEADVETVAKKLAVLRQHCEKLERDYDSIQKTVVRDAMGRSTSELVDECGQLAELGIQHVIFVPDKPYDTSTMDMLIKDVVPQVQAL